MRLQKKFLKLGTNTDELNARDIPSNFTPSSYTPTQVASEGTDKISAHLKGIDTALSSITGVSGDIAHTSFNALDNQVSPQNITGFSFNNAVVRSFDAIVSVTRGSTYAHYRLSGIQKAATWEVVQDGVGDDTGITFSITTGGQLQYTSTNTGSNATIKFRAQVTQV